MAPTEPIDCTTPASRHRTTHKWFLLIGDRILTAEEEPGEVEVLTEQVGDRRTSLGPLILYAALAGLLYVVFSFGTLVVGFVMPGDMVGEERRSGTIMMWAQHPVPLTSFYMRQGRLQEYATRPSGPNAMGIG